MSVDLHFLYKTIKNSRKLEKITAKDGWVMVFNKMLEVSVTNNTPLYKVVMEEWSMLCLQCLVMVH
jgi:hypothetical protein